MVKFITGRQHDVCDEKFITKTFYSRYYRRQLLNAAYFKFPYSWQKSHIENTYMIYREYIPCNDHFQAHINADSNYNTNSTEDPNKKLDLRCHLKNYYYICKDNCNLVWEPSKNTDNIHFGGYENY